MKKTLSNRETRDLFNKIAVESGVSSVDIVKRVYYGMIRVIGSDLRAKMFIVLPGWGKFRVHRQKERRYGDLRTKEVKTAPATNIIKYVPDNRLKEYVKSLK